MQRPTAVALVCCALALAASGAAYAHDRETNNGVSVTVHVAPDDDPIATQPSTIVVEKIETKARFTWATCKCTWRISDSTGTTLFLGKARPRMPFVFPASGAYEMKFVGRVWVKKTRRWRTFKILYALRAEPPNAS